jgi:hypothetical protein
VRCCMTLWVAAVFVLSGEAAFCQTRPQACQTVEFHVGRVRQVSICRPGRARVSAYISTRGAAKVTVGPPSHERPVPPSNASDSFAARAQTPSPPTIPDLPSKGKRCTRSPSDLRTPSCLPGFSTSSPDRLASPSPLSHLINADKRSFTVQNGSHLTDADRRVRFGDECPGI